MEVTSVFSYIDSTTLLVFIFVIILTHYCLMRRDSRVPPGPCLVPVLGNLLSMANKDPLGNLARLRKKYGDIYGLYMGNELTVFLNGFDVINDALIKKGSLFSRRPMTPFMKAVDANAAIISANDKQWKEQRAFTMQALQQLCYRNQSKHIETIILREIKKLIKTLDDHEGAVNPKPYLGISAANVVSSVIWSKSFELDDVEFTGFLNKVSGSTASMLRKIVLINCFPFLLKLPVDVLDMKTVFYGINTWHKMVEKRVYATDEESAENDFVDIYLQKVHENENGSLGQSFTKRQLCCTSFDLLLAGSDTSSTTVAWLLLHLLNNPDIQTRLQREIDDVIGQERLPSLSDRPNMPYTEATILEVLRLCNPAPLAVPHSVPHDVIFKGYMIRKDTTVIANIRSVMMDPNLWKDPDTFRPERFLSADLKTLDIPKYYMPFSLGPRSCLGETLAKMEVFLYTTSLLQRFSLKREGVDNPPIKGHLGITYTPELYVLHFVKR